MPRPCVLVGLLFLLSVPTAQAQSPNPSSSLRPETWEVTATLSFPSYLGTSAPEASLTTNRGVGARIGIRPTSSRRTLVEAYGLYAPQRRNAYDPAPRLATLGVRTALLARRADRRINPYVSAGMGLWHLNGPPRTSCRPAEGCLSEGSSSFQDGTTLSLTLGVGTYVILFPAVALRAAATAHAPLALGGDQGTPHPVLLIGVSIRP